MLANNIIDLNPCCAFLQDRNNLFFWKSFALHILKLSLQAGDYDVWQKFLSLLDN